VDRVSVEKDEVERFRAGKSSRGLVLLKAVSLKAWRGSSIRNDVRHAIWGII
jgi:hypothetical protein